MEAVVVLKYQAQGAGEQPAYEVFALVLNLEP